MKKILFIILLSTNSLYGQSVNELSNSIKSTEVSKVKIKPKMKIQEEKEQSIFDYSSIKKVLKDDGLRKHKMEKLNQVKNIVNTKKKIVQAKYNYPSMKDFWSFMSEYWLVKNAQVLQWDISKPDYGISVAFKNLLEKIGYFHKKIKILVVNSPDITHAAIPGNKGEYFFLISIPFMRTLDLTKVDIALLFLESMFRIDQGAFKENIKTDLTFIGTNFANKKPNMKQLKSLLLDYDRILYKDGYSFQQQYKVTKQMDKILKSDPPLWSAYLKMINKIDRLIKSNLLYKDYNKIYPSPQLQIKWLTPKKKIL